jgi:hypothetical protein
MVANIMGDFTKIGHQQKLERVRSGIRAAQNAGKWTGRVPRGFTVRRISGFILFPRSSWDREALARLSRGESQEPVRRHYVPEEHFDAVTREQRVELYEDRRRALKRRAIITGQ